MKKYIVVSCFHVILMIITLFIMPCKEEAYAEDTLGFDQDGNLVFATYNKAATSKIRYKTVGWVIKKYDEALNENGQISGVIPLPEFYYRVEDKNNPGYVYIYFIIKKADVMSVIEKESPKWKEYLEKYGGKVYLDSVMTVNQYGELTGGLNSDGSHWGEIYYDFDGISNARWWADPECLREYFNIPVLFPRAYHTPPHVEYEENPPEYTVVNQSIMTGTSIGSHSISDQEYDVGQGIPSGEDLYVYGIADKYWWDGRFIKNSGKVKVPVMVTTDYELKWTDKKGQPKSEIQRIEQWYLVEKPYEYYTIDYFDVYNLQEMQVTGRATGNVTEKKKAEVLGAESKKYGSAGNHIEVAGGKCYGGKITIQSANHLKPDIRELNQKELAEKSHVSVKTRNDRLVFLGSVILNDEWGGEPGIKALKIPEKSVFYITDIEISDNVKNGSVTDGKAVYVYKCGDKTKKVTDILGSIIVHTPVVCNGGVLSPRKYNMSVNPRANQIVLGTDFGVKVSTLGEHRNIKGYGYRDYKSFTGSCKVKFPFPVIIKGKNYSKDIWIEMTGENQICFLPDNIKTGKYNIEFMAAAKNAPGNNIQYGDGANLETSQYGARSTVQVEVIGTIYGFNINNGKDRAYVGDRIGFKNSIPDNGVSMPLVADTDNSYKLSIYSNGFGAGDTDKITAKLTYYCIWDGKRQEADIYIEEKRDILSEGQLKKAPGTVMWTSDNKIMTADNIFLWETDFCLEGSIVALPKGMDISNRDNVKKYALRGENILINFEITGYCGQKAENSYINVENYEEGYCNMWKTEGYNYEFVDKICGNIIMEDGDGLIIGIPGRIYEDYEVVGTH